jgi:peptidyl-prolyl cis-trans isomerase C
MKKFMLVALMASCISPNALAADPATVNGKPIKQSTVDFIIKDATAQGKQVDDNAQLNIIEKLITSELIDQEAQKSGVDKQPDFVTREELTRRELRINAFIEDYIKKNPIDDQAVRSEYDRFKAQLSGKEYKASHILVSSEDEAKDVIAQLAKGADFARIAKERTIDSGSKDNGGDLGWFLPESMAKPFSDATVKLQKGLYTTAPIQTEFGWHVIRLEDVRDTQPPAFDAVKNEIRTSLQRQQLDKLVNSLRDKAKIVKNSEAKPTK